MFIKITEDGIGRCLATTPSDIEGIYTEEIQTCIAIILIGDQKVSMIHDTGKLNLEKNNVIWDEVNLINPQEISIAYNSNIAKFPAMFENVKKSIRRFKDFLAAHYSSIPISILSLKKHFVTVTRGGEINHQSIPENVDESSSVIVRRQINIANSLFLDSDETVTADIQYTGYEYITSYPPLLKTSEQVMALITNNAYKFSLPDIKPLLINALMIRFLITTQKMDELEDFLQKDFAVRVVGLRNSNNSFRQLLIENPAHPMSNLILNLSPEIKVTPFKRLTQKN